MEELVDFLSWVLEADKAFARDNGLMALAAVGVCCPFHKSPPTCLVSLLGNPNRALRENSADDREFPPVHPDDASVIRFRSPVRLKHS